MMSETSLPKVSILMATYNGAAYLIEQLDSLRAQDYPHFDLLVCDDVSTDDTLELLKRYQQQYPELVQQTSLRWQVKSALHSLTKERMTMNNVGSERLVLNLHHSGH